VRLRVAIALLVLPLASAVVFGGACKASLVHTWGAFRYDAEHDCFDDAEILDVIDGPDPGSCPVVHCWVNSASEIFVTDKACDAPLDLKESTAGDCASALNSFKTRVKCVDVDGGTDAS
jgi:hypothetical protein